MRYAPQHKAQTRARVLREAAAVIRADGPERLGVASIMSRVGLTQGGFYAHFASKDDLLAEAIDLMFADIRTAFFSDNDTADPQTVLARYIERYLSMAHRDARITGCPVPILAGEFHRLPDRARERFAAGVARMKARITTLLKSAGVDKAQVRSESAVAEMVGAVSIARVTDDVAVAKLLLTAALHSVRLKLNLAVTKRRKPTKRLPTRRGLKST